MKLVQWTAYACFGLAVFSVFLAMAEEAPAFLGAGVAVLVTGVGFLAAHLGLVLLRDIRDALVPKTSTVVADAAHAEPAAASFPQNVRSAAEIAADLKALKART